MDALTLLHTRNSVSKLTEPAPSEQELALMLKAGLRAPDHARLRPWRFLSIRGQAREKLGELFVLAAKNRLAKAGEPLLDQVASDKLAAKALRAPLLLVVVADIKPHPKVPEVEQLLSAGCAAHSVLLAAQAMGYGGIWRTGSNAYDEMVKQGLGLGDAEQIVGYLYLGSIEGATKPIPDLDPADFCRNWEG